MSTPSYDEKTANAARVVCILCKAAYDHTHPRARYVCVWCQKKAAR